MVLRQVVVALAASGALAAHPAAQAQSSGGSVIGCPAGQAVQSLSIAGKTLNCIPVPPPVNLGAVNTAISTEAQTRADADTTLFGEIVELRAKVEETSIAGRWAFTGTQTCLSSSSGFNPTTLAPVIVFPLPSQGTILSVSSTTVSGVRVFNAPDPTGAKTGTSTATFHTLTHPTDFILGTGGFRSGGAAVTTLANTFTYDVQDDTVVIDDQAATGPIIKGGIGGTIGVVNVPRSVGKISKDRRTIQVMQEDVVVEQSTFTPPTPPGGLPTIAERVCNRVRTLTKID